MPRNPMGRYFPLSSIAFKSEYWDNLSATTGCSRHRLMNGLNRMRMVLLNRDMMTADIVLRGSVIVSWVIIVCSSSSSSSSSI